MRKIFSALALMVGCIVPVSDAGEHCRFIDTYRRRKVRFHVTQSSTSRLNVPFIRELGVQFISAADGRALVALDLSPWHLNSWEVAHGGVIMSLLDVAMAVAGRTLDADAEGGVTVEMKTSFLQPAKAGTRLLVSAHAFHRSSTMAFCEGEVRDTDDRLIAKAMGTFKYRRKSEPNTGTGRPDQEKLDV
jgi:acyl-CoA thioesterase